MFDLGIINGKIYIEGEWFKGNLYIKDEKICAITSAFLQCREEYNAQENMVLPGFIDAHVHFSLRVGSYTSTDDFITGSRIAALAGITTYIDFLDPIKNRQQLHQAFEDRIQLAKGSSVDYAFHAAIAQPKEEADGIVKDMKEFGIPTIKLFTTYSSSQRRTYDNYIDDLLRMSKEQAIRILVHAENEELMDNNPNIPVQKHGTARPPISEISEVLKLAAMTEYRDGQLYIVHTNCGTTIEELQKRYSDLLHKDIILESCPHYFTFSALEYEKEEGYIYTMTPPLRPEEEVEKMKANIDSIDVIGTDHCPFSKEEKNQSLVGKIPMGIPGISNSFFKMYTLFGQKIIKKYTVNPAKIHGLYPKKGTLLPGADGDVVVFDPKGKWTASGYNDGNPYAGETMTGKILATVLRGKFVVKDGSFTGGMGMYQRRELNQE